MFISQCKFQFQWRLLTRLGGSNSDPDTDRRILRLSASVLRHLTAHDGADGVLSRASGVALALGAAARRRLASDEAKHEEGAASLARLARGAAASHAPALRAAECLRHDRADSPRTIRQGDTQA